MVSQVRTEGRTIVLDECYTCGISIAITELQQRHFREKGGDFICVLGHRTAYRQSEVDRLKERLGSAQDGLARDETRYADAIRQLEEEHKATKRLHRRVNAGVCPHCNRTFQPLQRHVKAKHPEVVEAVRRRCGE